MSAEDITNTKNTTSWHGTGYVFPFMLDDGFAKGRLVRLGEEFYHLISNHHYDDCVNEVLGELLAFGAALIMDTKTATRMTLQITQGALIPMIVAEISHEGHIRGCANYDSIQLKQFLTHTPYPTIQDLFGKGQFVLTTYFELSHDIQQAIIDLQGNTLEECLQHYFEHSAQLKTVVKLFSDMNPASSDHASSQDENCIVDLTTKNFLNKRKSFLAGALVLQKLPSKTTITGDDQNYDTTDEQDLWNTYVILLETLSKNELLSPTLSAENILNRLYHTQDIFVFPSKPIVFKCTCSNEKLLHVLKTISLQEREAIAKNGVIEADCKFCGTFYSFTVKDISGEFLPG